MSDAQIEASTSRRRLFVMRHAERCDYDFGRAWMSKCFDVQGQYTRSDMNLPVHMVARESYMDFMHDCPLTATGRLLSREIGEAFQMANVDFKHVFASPALRCVETAHNVIYGLNTDLQIKIEPLSFEWRGFHSNQTPVFMTPQELSAGGYNVDLTHQPLVTENGIYIKESVENYYNRCYEVARHITTTSQGDCLVVAHGSSLDTFTRKLLGKPPRSSQNMHQILPRSYCAMCCVGEDPSSKRWTLQDPSIPPLHGFDWRILL